MNEEHEEIFEKRIRREEANNPDVKWAKNLVFKTEVDEIWLDRFFNRFFEGLASSKTVSSHGVYTYLIENIFPTLDINTVSVTSRKFNSTGRAYHEIVFTLKFPEICADLALLAYKSK